uniref:Uncharacterized protein n=1 Tax=Anguilla anguilla TaxID=7936 RepID=A0A0E9SJ81_ANGAN
MLKQKPLLSNSDLFLHRGASRSCTLFYVYHKRFKNIR